MADSEDIALFNEFDEDDFRIRVHTVTVSEAACFVLQAVVWGRGRPK